jgi:GT2 family glycosyltransferase
MDLSIIIVSWNVKEKLRENLAAIFKSQGKFSCEVFVVDNDSGDGSAGMVQSEFPQVRLIVNQANSGFAKANNQAIRIAQGRYVLLLNPDMRVFPETLASMLDWMDQNPQASVAGCHLIDQAGKTILHVRRFPKIWDQLAIVLKLPHLFTGVLDKYLIKSFDYGKSSKVDSIRGAFFMIRHETIDNVGRLDERFFLWFEEVDYCLRVIKAKGEVWYSSAAQCVDFIGQSFEQVPKGQTQVYFRDSMLKYFRKWHPAWQCWILMLAWPVGISMAVMAEKFKASKNPSSSTR